MRSRKAVSLVAAMALAASGLAACGDDEESATSPPPPATETETTDATAGDGGEPVAIAAASDGDLAYQQDSLTAPAGSVTFEFMNPSSVPHDFNIEQDGEDVAGTEVITNAEAELTADLKPGTYTFYCSVANHREEGMEGELIVE